MEELSGIRFDGGGNAVKKKRSQSSRRPRADSQSFGGRGEPSSLSSTPPSDDVTDQNIGVNGSYKRKELRLNQCIPKTSSSTQIESEKPRKRIYREDGGFDALHNNSDPGRKRSREGALAPANRRSSSSKELETRSSDVHGRKDETQRLADGVGNENKVKKVKLKVGGVTCTIHANNSTNGAPGGGSSAKSSQLIDGLRMRPKQNIQGSQNPPDKGINSKDFSKSGFGIAKADPSMARTSGKNNLGKQEDASTVVQKSKRVPKKRALDGEFGEDDDDEEIRYLEKLKASRVSVVYKEDGEEGSKKERNLSKISNAESFNTSRSIREGKRSRSNWISEGTDYGVAADNLASDTEIENKKKKKQEDSVEPLREMTLTTRQRALQSSKDAPGSSGIEFPNGLPPAPPRKQKEKLTEVEQQVKKAEAAQRRRMQVEKAARESEAEAIRKILGQDSSRKKREDKIKKRQEEIAQEKAANALVLQPNTVRWRSTPTGTVVSFPDDVGLPRIFDPKPNGYPPAREKCGRPSCSNPYKYRDSKTKVPLCSLQCYKAVHEQLKAECTS